MHGTVSKEMKKQRIPEPVKTGRAKVPVIIQFENLECGAVSLCMVLGYYGKWLPPGQVRGDTGPCRDGANAYHIAKAAESYGLDAQVLQCDADTFFEKASFPCIVHWQYNHFLVVTGFRGETVWLNDPKRGNYKLPVETFRQRFTGFCVFFSPGGAFQPEGHRKTLLEFIRERLSGLRDMLLFVLLTTLLVSILTVLNQGMSRMFLDRLLGGDHPEWETPFLWILSAVTAAQLVIRAVQAVNMVRIQGKLSVVGSTTYMWHVLRLPVRFFSQRMTSDIFYRKYLNVDVAGQLVNIFGPLFLQVAMMVLYLAIMVRYSPLLTIIGLSAILLNAVLGHIIAARRMNITREQMSASASMNGMLFSGLQMIETIKASGAENGYFEVWSGYQAQVNAQQASFAKVDQSVGVLPQLVSMLSGNLILLLGAFLIMNGEFTPGSLMAFQGILNLFNQPASDLINASRDLQQMRTNMERIDDVMECGEDPILKGSASASEPPAFLENSAGTGDGGSAGSGGEPEFRKLTGQLSMQNIRFGYSRLEPPLIEDFSLELQPGKSVALVGPSGCGKSTLAKLISGLYQPWEGTISFDGKPLSEIDPRVLRGSLAVVDQDIILFADSVQDNIKMWDSTIENYEMILAARDAQIHTDIMKREKGYRHRMLPDGKDFSGGERQRLEIARVLAQDPTIVILDEATSALDARTEYGVVRGIRERGITCIVIAHRLSTIRDCDEIVVLRHGHVIEHGDHDTLLRKNGLYAELIKSE